MIDTKPLRTTILFRYTLADLFAAPRTALKPKRVAIGTFFALASYGCMVASSFLGMVIDGERLGFVISVYGFFPPILKSPDSPIAIALWYCGLGLGFLLLLQGMTALALVAIADLRGTPGLSIMKAIQQGFARLPQLLGAFLGFAFIILLLFALLLLIGFVGHIPVIGEWTWSVLLVMPGFLLAMALLGMLYCVSATAISFLPSVIAADSRKEIFGPIVEIFSIILRQPLRWLFSTILAFGLAKFAGFIYAYVTVKAIDLISVTSAVTGGTELPRLIEGGMSHLSLQGKLGDFFFFLYPGSDISVPLHELYGRPSSESISYFCAFMLGILFATIAGYMLSVFTATITRGYILIAYAKDNRRITEA
jgi:hypothetical protein